MAVKKEVGSAILTLRSQGKTYKEISETLGCTKSTVHYHCSTNGKVKAKERGKNLRAKRKADKAAIGFVTVDQ